MTTPPTHDALIEKMVAAYLDKLEPYTDASGFDHQAAMRAALAVVLAHYSDPENVSDGMLKAVAKYNENVRPLPRGYYDYARDHARGAIAAAMKAALTES